MKRAALLAVALSVALPAAAEWRADVGFDIPRGIGGLSEDGAVISEDAGEFFDSYVFPFPELGLYWYRPVGAFRAGVGLRAFTFILETVFWPNAFAEYDLWRVTFAFQLGGGAFGLFGLLNQVQTGAVLIPDLSAWLRLGRTFRIGGGALGLMLPELDGDVAFIYYFGLKFTIGL